MATLAPLVIDFMKKSFLILITLILGVSASSLGDEIQPPEAAYKLIVQYLASIETGDLNSYSDVHHPNRNFDISKVWKKWKGKSSKQTLSKLKNIYQDKDLLILRADVISLSQKRFKADIIFILQKWGADWKILDISVLDEQPMG